MKTLRVSAALAITLLLVAACGREGPPDELLTVGRAATSPTPVEGTDAPDATTKPEATGRAAGVRPTPAATTQEGATATTGPVRTAEPGKTQPPKDGRYTYDFSGKGTDPANPSGPERSFEGESYTDVSHSADVYTFETTNSEEAGRTTTRTRWSASKVELLEISIETPIGTYGCKFDPPLVITKFPVKPESYPTQTFKGEGNACNGKLDITIVRQEAATDATGRSWNTWRVKVRTEVRSTNLTAITNETRWASPDLGIEIRSEATSNGEFKSGTFSSKFSGENTRVLKKPA